jgi:predicted nucleic acid-binding protein
MIFVDTGYLFAITTPGDQLHLRAMSWARAIRERLLTTEYVLWELVNGLSRLLDRPQAHALLDDIHQSSAWDVIEARRELFSRGLAIHRQHADKEWSLTDCISFLVMRDRGISRALTHDHHFEQAGFEALLRRDPP